MGEWANSGFYNSVTWISVVMIIGLTMALLGITLRGSG
jgi:Mn2+/Fe2+ NRAMP family transporter